MRQVFIRVNGLNVNYEITGQGRELTLVHGAASNLKVWFNQVPTFAQGYRVLTYDVRGFGQSEQSVNDFTMDDLIEDFHQLLLALGIQKTFVAGHSMGGNIAQWLAVKHPDILKGLVLSNSTSGANWNEAEAGATYQRFMTMAENMERLSMKEYVAQRLTANFSPGFVEAHKELVARYQEAQSASDARSCARTMRMLARRTLPDPRLIKCPTLVITGEHDALAGPPIARTLHEGIAGSRLVVLPTGHASPFEAWELWNKAVLEFLDSVS